MTRAIVLFVIALGAATLTSPAGAQQMYRWTDKNGRVHITDTPPPAGARGVQQSRGSAAPAASAESDGQQPYELTLAIKDYPVSLYTSPTCKEPCQQARDHLNKRGVPFREIQVFDTATSEELKRVSGSNQVPAMVVGGSVQTGYAAAAFDGLLDSARYPKAGSVKPRAQAAPAPPEGLTSANKAPPAEEPARPRGPYAPR